MFKLALSFAIANLFVSSGFGITLDFKNVLNGVWSTGLFSNASLVAGSGADPHYLLTPPASCSIADITCLESAGDLFGPSSYVVAGPNGTYPLDGTWSLANDTVAGPNASQWIGPRANQTNPLVGGPTVDGTAPKASDTEYYVYRINFNLNLIGALTGGYSIQLRWLSDSAANSGGSQLSRINLCPSTGSNDSTTPTCGNTVASGNPGQTSAGFGAPVTISGFVQSGWQSLDFIVFNSVLPEGELNPTGLRVLIDSATVDTNAVPEPGTLGHLTAALLGLEVWRRTRRRR